MKGHLDRVGDLPLSTDRSVTRRFNIGRNYRRDSIPLIGLSNIGRMPSNVTTLSNRFDAVYSCITKLSATNKRNYTLLTGFRAELTVITNWNINQVKEATRCAFVTPYPRGKETWQWTSLPLITSLHFASKFTCILSTN